MDCVGWDSPLILHDQNILLSADVKQTNDFILAWRQVTLLKAQMTQDVFEAAERQAFREKSYYHCWDGGLNHPASDEVVAVVEKNAEKSTYENVREDINNDAEKEIRSEKDRDALENEQEDDADVDVNKMNVND
ncbi:hypothetical protein MMC09_005750 [Bachmanniomyces sp. S44760]|nr:hypothetical protein [Bachmanniomyces sp. S44760]